MPFSHKLPRLTLAAVLVAGLFTFLAPISEARGRNAIRKSRAKLRAYARASRSMQNRYTPESGYAVVPDSIEVIENGSSNLSAASRWLNLPSNSSTVSASYSASDTSTRRFNVNIAAQRVLEIQQALAGRGYYRGEMTGTYDELTVDAMRRFQSSEGIPVTGYPTAHALKRLGLAR